MRWLWQGGSNPKDIPQWAYMHLVTVLKVDPDHLLHLKCVEQTNFNGDVLLNLIRIYDDGAMKGMAIEVKDFTSLDQYPELILYEGYKEKESERIYIRRGILS
jgi:hypothetical protein